VTKSRVYPVVPITAIRSLSYLDYIFNPCSLLSITFGMNLESFNSYVAGISRENGSFLNIDLAGHIVTGEIVSYSVSRDGPDSAPTVTALLMPPGVSRTIMASRFSLSSLGNIQVMKSPATFSPTWVSPRLTADSDDLSYTVNGADSIIAAFMAYRKTYAARAFPVFLLKSKQHLHRLVYAMFPAVKRTESGLSTGLFQVPVLAGDINFSDLKTGDRLDNALSYRNPQTSFAASSQGLLNSAYTFLPRLAPTLSNMVGHYINETATITIGPNPPGQAFATLLAFPRKSPTNLGDGMPVKYFTRTFGACVFDPSPTDMLPVWTKNTPVRHLRTQYSYSDDGSNGATGHQISVMVGRFNSDLAPQGG